MSDDQWEDVDTYYRISVTLPPGPILIQQRRVSAVLREDQQDNWISTSVLLKLFDSRQEFGDVNSFQSLQWRPAQPWALRLTMDLFRIRDDIDVDVVLGGRACREIETYNQQRLDDVVLPAITDTSDDEQARQEARNAETRRRDEARRQKQIERIRAKYDPVNPGPGQNQDQGQPPASSGGR